MRYLWIVKDFIDEWEIEESKIAIRLLLREHFSTRREIRSRGGSLSFAGFLRLN